MLSFVDEGYRLVPLHSVVEHEDGTFHCSCEQARMHKAGYRDSEGKLVEDCTRVGKHPTTVGYTKKPVPFSEQRIEIEVEEGGSTGYGVLLHFEDYQLIVIDVDNHGSQREGDRELSSLCEAYPDISSALMSCGLIVNTSNGGKHYYFKAPAGAYISHIDGYENIDIKVSGFVAGPGSVHKTGIVYTAVKNATAEDITEAPAGLIELLKAPEAVEQRHNGRTYSADSKMISDMLSYISHDKVSKYDNVTYESYDAWLHVGMSIHAATCGSTEGLEIWDEWSQQMNDYDYSEIQYKWLSFSSNEKGKTLGYLFDEARHCGWIPPAREGAFTGKSEAYVEIPVQRPSDIPEEIQWPSPSVVDSINRRQFCDLTTPPGGVGAISEYILRSGYKPRPSLSVAAAIFCAATASAFNVKEKSGRPVPTNTIQACAAGSGTGKNSVINAVAYLLDFINMSSAMNGDFKSGQAITRALVEHQAAIYVMDEFGEKISQVIKAHGGEAQSYLATVISQVMSMYSQSTERAVIERELARASAKDVLARLKEIKNSIEPRGVIKAGVAAEADVEEVALDLQRGKLEKKAPQLHQEWLRELETRCMTAEEDAEGPLSGTAAWDVADRHVVGRMDGERESLQRVSVQLRGNYIARPYLSMFGVTTGETFFPCMTPALIKNGLWGRAMLYIEHDDAPWPAERADDAELLALRWNAEDVVSRIAGSCSNHFRNVGRVEEMKERETLLEYEKEALEMLGAIKIWESVKAKSRYAQSTGATALYNRAAELTQRLATILAIAEPPRAEKGKCDDGSTYKRVSVMSVEHVRWAYAMIESDTARKNLLLVAAMDDDPQMIRPAVECRLRVHTPRGEEHSIWRDALIEKIATGAITRNDVASVIDELVSKGIMQQKQVDANPFDTAMGAEAEENVKIWWVVKKDEKKACVDENADVYLNT